MTSTADFLADVKRRIDHRLERYFDHKRAEVRRLSPHTEELVESVHELTMRGGKRLRPAVTAAVFRAVKPEADLVNVVDVGAALELLQTYLLIHDDFMDQDDERRGGPAVHAMFRQKRGDAHLGASLAILAGDLAGTYAWELVLDAPFPTHRRDEGLHAFVTLQKEVYFGQHLDVIADPDVERMHDLKTGSYTVRGPAMLGAILGDASEDQKKRLLHWANPLGEAFQLADDLLGTFGTSEVTGKPGDDLVHGKRTSLVIEAEHRFSHEAKQKLHHVLGKSTATPEEVGVVIELMIHHGVKAAVEARMDARLAEALAAVDEHHFSKEGVALLRDLGRRLAKRQS